MTAENGPLIQAAFVFSSLNDSHKLMMRILKATATEVQLQIISSLHGDSFQTAASPPGWTEAPRLRVIRSPALWHQWLNV